MLLQLRSEARDSNLEVLDHVRSSPDTTVKATLFEDGTALAGLGLAAAGLTLRQVTGSPGGMARLSAFEPHLAQ